MSDPTQTPAAVSHTEAAQVLIEKIHALRDSIPNLVIPSSPRDSQRLTSAARVSHDFVEMTVTATANSDHLAVAGSLDAEKMRDLLSYAEAYGPAVAQLEAVTEYLKHSVVVAKNQAGRQALLTYSIARRLAKQPPTAYLAPIVAAMREKLGLKGRSAKAQPAPETPPATKL